MIKSTSIAGLIIGSIIMAIGIYNANENLGNSIFWVGYILFWIGGFLIIFFIWMYPAKSSKEIKNGQQKIQ